MRKVYVRGRWDVQSTAQCLARWSGGQAADRSRSRSGPERTGTGKFLRQPSGRPSTAAVATRNPQMLTSVGQLGHFWGDLLD